jgi:hypothetical protein
MKSTNNQNYSGEKNDCLFEYSDDINSGKFRLVTNNGNVSPITSTIDTGITVVANTPYDLEIDIGTDGVVRGYINGTLVATTAALYFAPSSVLSGTVMVAKTIGTTGVAGYIDYLDLVSGEL